MGSSRAAAGVALAAALALGTSGARAAVTPAISNVSGGLLAAGPISGSTGIAFDVSDSEGVQSVALIVDTTTVASETIREADWDALLDVDTATLHDGLHQFAVTVTDGDGVTTTVWQELVDTFNAPLGGTPSLNGDDEVGQTLVAADGDWSPSPTSYAYQWLRCNPGGSGCAAIGGATGPSYTLLASDASDVLEVAVTATDTGGSTTATSSPSATVADANASVEPPLVAAPALAPGQAPQISGQAAEGQTLTVAPGSWSAGPLTFAYQWQRCDAAGGDCAAIVGASAATYTLAGADAGAAIRVLVSATGAGGTTQAASAPTTAVASGALTPTPAAPASVPGAPNGAHACINATLRARVGGAASVTVALGRAVTLRGSLRCGHDAVADARVEVVVAPLDGGGPTRHASVSTSDDGAFAYVLGRGASRRVTLSYRAYAGETAPAARAGATLLVRPSVSLRIAPSATSNGHTITFTGTVSGGHEPAGGLTLQVEYREGSAWMIYTTFRSGAGGSFLWRYTFRRTTESITYWFRVAIPSSGVVGYPFEPTASPARSVHVVP